MLETVQKDYFDAVLHTDKQAALNVIENALTLGIAPNTLVFEVVVPGVEQMLQALMNDFDATISQHFIASQIADEATERLFSEFTTPPATSGTAVIGTAAGDFHGLGKKIVIGCLKTRFIKVIDLGLNVSPEKFVDTAIETNAQVIGVSSMMIHTACGDNGPKKIKYLLEQKEKTDEIKLIVGGAPYRFDPDLYRTVGADAWAENGVRAAALILQICEDQLCREVCE